MSTLDKVLDVVMKEKENLIEESAPKENKEELISALREHEKKQIIEEIRQEYKQEIQQQVQAEMQKKLNKEKLSDLKRVLIEGLFLAFCVGLLVNQFTDLLGFWKGTISQGSIGWTICCIVVLVVICCIAFLVSFFARVSVLLADWEKE